MKNKPFFTGLIAVASPIPMIIFTVFWFWIWFFAVGMGLLNYETVPDWISICGLFPLVISPILCVVGIAHGCIKIKQKYAWLGIMLSAIGLVENFLLIYGMGYIGSRF